MLFILSIWKDGFHVSIQKFTETKLINSSDEGQDNQYFLFPLSSLIQEKLSLQNNLTQQTIIELVVRLTFCSEEHLLRSLADTGARSKIILEKYKSAPFIKNYHSNTITCNTIGDKFTTSQTGICL
jgi:hypothetical protein